MVTMIVTAVVLVEVVVTAVVAVRVANGRNRCRVPSQVMDGSRTSESAMVFGSFLLHIYTM